MEYRFIAASIALIITYSLIALRGVSRRFDVPAWVAMLIGASIMIATGVVTPSEALGSINLNVIIFLFSLFTIASALEVSGFLSYVAYRLVSSSRKMYNLIGKVFLSSAVLSMVISNDGLAASFTPMIIESGKAAEGIDVKPLLYALAYGVTIGSVMMPIGNPQNLLIAIESGIPKPFVSFIKYLAVPTLINLAVTYILMLILFRKRAMDDLEVKRVNMRLNDPALSNLALVILVIIVVVLVASDLVGLNLDAALIALIGATVVYALSDRRGEVLSNVDWQTLVFFMGLFIVSEGAYTSGVLNYLAHALPAPTTLWGIFLASILLSQVISNVPMVALYLPLMTSLGVGPGMINDWVGLAAASTIAGNLTLIGAASNIIILQASEKRGGPRFSYVEFLLYGIPVTLVNASIYYAYLKLI
ncbi:SLC13 family permease [Caldivirga maquilingensis]|uniref:Citrate transporter n=1 Tax=Caldivirga maquilingensis (strain ATCC 700844 / DSM 13496 / JCM 10307 / IC-167) TaxID=397948 RepID=A8MDI9_CALMQ|nr:SLC13 family permease [Caldivirga maquilingensis]ABW01845.1 Citrate transporter [Caldivirga maquilingensis IC-167]